jgi:hypothetical protein
MLRYLLTTILVVATCSPIVTPTFADEPGIKRTEARVVNLPQDQGKIFVTIFGDPSQPRTKEIISWFETVPELKAVKAQTHFNVIDTNSTMFTSRYANHVAKLPCVRVETKDAVRLYQASDKNIPLTGEALANAVNTGCLLRWRRRNNQQQPARPDYQDNADENDVVDHDVVDHDVVDLKEEEAKPAPTPADNGFSWLRLVASMVAGAAAGAGYGGVQAYRAKYRTSVQ